MANIIKQQAYRYDLNGGEVLSLGVQSFSDHDDEVWRTGVAIVELDPDMEKGKLELLDVKTGAVMYRQDIHEVPFMLHEFKSDLYLLDMDVAAKLYPTPGMFIDRLTDEHIMLIEEVREDIKADLANQDPTDEYYDPEYVEFYRERIDRLNSEINELKGFGVKEEEAWYADYEERVEDDIDEVDANGYSTCEDGINTYGG